LSFFINSNKGLFKASEKEENVAVGPMLLPL